MRPSTLPIVDVVEPFWSLPARASADRVVDWPLSVLSPYAYVLTRLLPSVQTDTAAPRPTPPPPALTATLVIERSESALTVTSLRARTSDRAMKAVVSLWITPTSTPPASPTMPTPRAPAIA